MKNNDKPMSSRVERHAKDYNKKYHVIAWTISIVAIIALGALAYFGYIYFKTKNALDNTYDPQTKVTIKKGEFNGKKKFAVLLMGTDTGALDRTDKRGNTDTIIVAIVNPQKKRYSLVSIPRDTMAQMVGSSNFEVQKINAAYAEGGSKMALKTVSKLIDVPLKYYAIVNMGGIMKMIKYVGGIDIKPTLSFEYGGYRFKKGQLTHMNGKAALAYSRMRYDDPQGDYGRQARQRQVIITLIKKAVSINSLSNLNSILSSVSGNVKTNLTFNALQQIGMNYRKSTKHVKSDYMHGISATIDESSYQIQPTKEINRISKYCRTELGLKPVKVNNNETYQNERNIQNGFDFNSDKTQEFHIYDYSGEGGN